MLSMSKLEPTGRSHGTNSLGLCFVDTTESMRPMPRPSFPRHSPQHENEMAHTEKQIWSAEVTKFITTFFVVSRIGVP